VQLQQQWCSVVKVVVVQDILVVVGTPVVVGIPVVMGIPVAVGIPDSVPYQPSLKQIKYDENIMPYPVTSRPVMKPPALHDHSYLWDPIACSKRTNAETSDLSQVFVQEAYLKPGAVINTEHFSPQTVQGSNLLYTKMKQ